ncbi:MAG: hypothetical protein Q9204_004409, partial [Flavoplaca sp. TL-2023a]
PFLHFRPDVPRSSEVEVLDDIEERITRADGSPGDMLLSWDVTSSDNIGFEVLGPAHLDILEKYGLRYHFSARPHLMALREQRMLHDKLESLYGKNPSILLHSLEGLIGKIDFDRIAHHKVHVSMLLSPSSTAAYLMNTSRWDAEAESYLRKSGQLCIGRLFMEEDGKEVQSMGMSGDVDPSTPTSQKDGSIIIVIATSTPLQAVQLQRLAKRATVGLARVGGWGSNGSGDVFLAFSTAHEIPRDPEINVSGDKPTVSQRIPVLEDTSINALFEAAADAVEEAIYNALCMAETMTGLGGKKVEALDLERVRKVMEKYL